MLYGEQGLRHADLQLLIRQSRSSWGLIGKKLHLARRYTHQRGRQKVRAGRLIIWLFFRLLVCLLGARAETVRGRIFAQKAGDRGLDSM